MSTTHLGRAVQFIIAARKTTQSQIAANAGLSQVVLSRACNGTRLESKTLRALCTSQNLHADNLEMLVGHLRDEIERAGHSPLDIAIHVDATPMEDDLRLLLENARHDPQLAELLRQLSGYVKTHPVVTESLGFAAEDQAPYDLNNDRVSKALLDHAQSTTPATDPTRPTPVSPKGKATPRG